MHIYNLLLITKIITDPLINYANGIGNVYLMIACKIE